VITQHMRNRRGYWYYVRRVPKDVRHLEPYPFIVRSTNIRVAHDPRGITATRRVRELDASQTMYWDDLIAGRDPQDRHLFERNKKIADKYSLPMIFGDDLDKISDEQFGSRMRLVEAYRTDEIISTMLGVIPRQTIKLSQLLEEYTKLEEATLATKSPNQLKKWRIARETTVNTFIEIIGSDVQLGHIERSHILAMRRHWTTQVANGKLRVDSANKYLGRLLAMLKAVCEAHQIETQNIFAKILVKGAKSGKRLSFSTQWVQDTLLAEGALAGLNPEARAIVYVIAETGIRLSEACNLDASTIKLDHEIPHIQIRANGRQLKTEQSERDIPILGVALMALRKHPNGFPRYVDKNPLASATINKFLRSRFKLEDRQTLYSLRHTFKNRLRSVQCGDEMSSRLMGHELSTPDYGEFSLTDKLVWLKKIAFIPPASL